jgi:hypothetical protein
MRNADPGGRCVVDDRSHSTQRSLLEIAVGYALILATIWSVLPARAIFGWMAVFWVGLVLLLEARTNTGFGLGLHGLRESFWALGFAFAVASIAVLCAGAMGTLHYHYVPRPYPPMTGYFAWSFAQQFILQNLFLSRLLRLLARPWMAICAAGLMLSMAHLPNLLLVAATLVWGVGSCWLFFHYRNLYVIGLIHFLFGISLSVCVPSSIQHNMRVGRSYALYRPVQVEKPLPIDKALQKDKPDRVESSPPTR